MANEPKKQQRKPRRYKGELIPKKSLDTGESAEGTFQSAKQIEITDQNTREKKDVWQYTFRDGAGKKFVMLGAFQLDSLFDEVFHREGGIEKCEGLQMKIIRGEDVKLSGKRTMGQYEIEVWEAS